jgi:uncharacterized protein YlxP (DUF503 family)
MRLTLGVARTEGLDIKTRKILSLGIISIQEPVKSAEEVIKEIDDLIEDSDAEEDDLSEHGNQVKLWKEAHVNTTSGANVIKQIPW